MNSTGVIGLLCLAAFAIGAPAYNPAFQKPVHVIDRAHPPSDYKDTNLDQLFFASEMVVLGTVKAIRPVDRNVGSADRPMVIIETAFDVSVSEVYRFTGDGERPPETVSVIIHHVGDRDRGAYIERYVNESVNPLRLNQQYLLFLRPRSGEQTWSLTSESGRAVVQVKGLVVAPQDSSPLALRIAKQGWSVLRAELHRLAKVR